MRKHFGCAIVAAYLGLFAGEQAHAFYGVSTNNIIGTFNGPDPQRLNVQGNGPRVLTDTFTYSDAGENPDVGRSFLAQTTSSLMDGTVRLRMTGHGGPAGNQGNTLVGAQGILFDEFTFVGTFSGQQVPFTAELDGSWTVSGPPLALALTNARMRLFAGGTVPNTDDWVGNASNDATPSLYDQTIEDDEFGDYPLTFSNTLTLNGTNPRVQFYFNARMIASSMDTNTSFDADFTHTAKVNFNFPQGVTVLSDSGTYPGTVPEPAVMSIVGVAILALRRR